MIENKTRLLLILSQDLLDQARVIAGRATTVLKLPVSLQIVLRALISVGLKRQSHSALGRPSRGARTAYGAVAERIKAAVLKTTTLDTQSKM